MAYYTDGLKKPNTEYTARRDINSYSDTITFRKHVYSWLNDRNIEYTWRGHGTSETEHSSTTFVTVSIPNEKDAMFFMLAWG